MKLKVFRLGFIITVLLFCAHITPAQLPYNGTPSVWPDGTNSTVYPTRFGMPTSGSAWVYLGNTSPIEQNDVFSSEHIEQGLSVYKHNQNFTVEVYGALDLNLDTQGQVWANNYIGQFGVRANYHFKHGIVTVGTARAYEDQWHTGNGVNGGEIGVPGIKAWQNEAFINTWFGWQTHDEHKYPGNTWTTIGNISPAEKGNLIMMTYVEQGYVAHRFSPHASLVPIITETFGVDNQRFDWNNFTRTGAGVSLKLPHYIEIDGVYNYEVRPLSGKQAGGVMMTLKIWHGWNLASVLKGRP